MKIDRDRQHLFLMFQHWSMQLYTLLSRMIIVSGTRTTRGQSHRLEHIYCDLEKVKFNFNNDGPLIDKLLESIEFKKL